jgi:hypothetical protein
MWDEYLFMHMQRGGNRRMKTLLEKFNIDPNAGIGYKYRTLASEYHRSLVNIINIA